MFISGLVTTFVGEQHTKDRSYGKLFVSKLSIQKYVVCVSRIDSILLKMDSIVLRIDTIVIN